MTNLVFLRFSAAREKKSRENIGQLRKKSNCPRFFIADHRAVCYDYLNLVNYETNDKGNINKWPNPKTNGSERMRRDPDVKRGQIGKYGR